MDQQRHPSVQDRRIRQLASPETKSSEPKFLSMWFMQNSLCEWEQDNQERQKGKDVINGDQGALHCLQFLTTNDVHKSEKKEKI